MLKALYNTLWGTLPDCLFRHKIAVTQFTISLEGIVGYTGAPLNWHKGSLSLEPVETSCVGLNVLTQNHDSRDLVPFLPFLAQRKFNFSTGWNKLCWTESFDSNSRLLRYVSVFNLVWHKGSKLKFSTRLKLKNKVELKVLAQHRISQNIALF